MMKVTKVMQIMKVMLEVRFESCEFGLFQLRPSWLDLQGMKHSKMACTQHKLLLFK